MWEMLYEEFWDKLEHFCFRLCRDEGRAEDMTQEVFLRALQNRALIESFTSGQCKAWLFAAARNLYCDQVRRAAREQQLLEQLPPEDRQLFLLRYQHGWNATQLGQQLGLPPATVRTRLARIRARLQQEMED